MIPEGQLSIDEAIAEGEAAMTQAHENAPVEWRDRAWAALVDWLETEPEFHVDRWWSESGIDEPPESRALGAIIQRASREGLMVKSGEWRPSVRSHGSPKPVWRSLVYRPEN